MTTTSPPPSLSVPVSACFGPQATWFRNGFLPDQEKLFAFTPNFAVLDVERYTTHLHPAVPPAGKQVESPVRLISRSSSVLQQLIVHYAGGLSHSLNGFQSAQPVDCAGIERQARMRHLTALMKLWPAATSVSADLRELLHGGASLYAFGSVFWNPKGSNEGPCVPYVCCVSRADRRLMMAFSHAATHDLGSQDYALGAHMDLKHF